MQKTKRVVVTQPTRHQIMTKALAAQKAGLLTAFDVSLAEHQLHRDRQMPDYIAKALRYV
jgi:hypothetical protein